jgi:hypothetical protein
VSRCLRSVRGFWRRIWAGKHVLQTCVKLMWTDSVSSMGSEMLKKFGAGDPSLGGKLIGDVVHGLRDGDAGKVVNKDGVQPW